MSIYQSPVIFPITALSKDPRAVKEAAEKSVVHITENGRGAYVFASMQAFEELIKQEREDAAYEAYLLEKVKRGVEDIEAGRYVTSIDEAFARAAELRAARVGETDA